MNKLLILIIFAGLVFSCNMSENRTRSTSRLLPEPDILERLEYQKAVADTLVADSLFCADTVEDTDERRMDGFWILEKTDVYDLEPDDPNLSGLYKRFDDIAFEIRRDMLYFNEGCASYGEPEKFSLEEYFYKIKDKDALKARFKHKFDVDLPDSLTICTLPWCESLSVDLLFLPEKVFLIDEGLFYGAYKKVGLKEFFNATGLDICPEGNEYTIEMGSVTQYVFYNMTIEQVYDDMLHRYINEAKHLRKKLPSGDVVYSSNVDDEDVIIRYHYDNVIKDLVIEMLYGGGVTTLEIVEYGDICLAYATYSAD